MYASSKKRGTISVFLPEELILTILLRVPAEDVIRMKAVCKQWLSLISNPMFAKAGLLHSKLRLLFPADDTTIRWFSIAIGDFNNTTSLEEFHLPRTKPLHFDLLCTSSDGLLLVSDRTDKALYVCNYVTRQCKSIPPLSDFTMFHAYAFVPDESTGKHKLFAMSNKNVLVVLTQGESAWRVLTQLHDANTYMLVSGASILVAKEVHFLICFPGLGLSYYIYSIDVATEKITKTEVPAGVYKTPGLQGAAKNFLSEGTTGGSLCLTNLSHFEINIWVLQDDLWAKRYSTSLQSLPNMPTSVKGFILSDAFIYASKVASKSSSVSDTLLILIRHEDHLFHYDLKNQELSPIGFLSKNEMMFPHYVYHCNSLISWL